jgi:hypothetical protein
MADRYLNLFRRIELEFEYNVWLSPLKWLNENHSLPPSQHRTKNALQTFLKFAQPNFVPQTLTNPLLCNPVRRWRRNNARPT